MLLRHVPFLRAVFFYSFTAFGGPQGHMGMMVRTFVQKRKDITEDELLSYNAFCQMLPGPSSTQTVMLIAMKRGGIPLAIVTLLLWVFPAAVLMGAFSFVMYYFNARSLQKDVFTYIQPMSVGFVCFAAAKMMTTATRHVATACIMVGALIVTLFVRSPWVFPGILVIAGSISNFSNRRIPDAAEKPKPINWVNLWLFAAIFILAGIFSEMARSRGDEWPHGRIFNVFENFYRFGSIVFGGGQALVPMMLFQFVNQPVKHAMPPLITSQDLMTGFGMVQAVPGPVFSIASFIGGMIMSGYGPWWQMLGCITATTALFLPSTLLLFFFFPIFHNLRNHVIIFRALEGINAAVVGIIWASGIVLFQALPFEWSNLVVITITFCLLKFTRIPSPFIVIGWMLLGWTMHL